MNLRRIEVFERRWAQAILQTALDRLRQEYATRGQAALFEFCRTISLANRADAPTRNWVRTWA